MSRVGKKPIQLPSGVDLAVKEGQIIVKGNSKELTIRLHPAIDLDIQDGVVLVKPKIENKETWMHAGTVRALINNMVVGVTSGFEKRLQLVGVGYRAQAKGNKLNLTVGYSHPVAIDIPKEVSVETPSQTEIVLKSADKQLVGQLAANIRQVRKPEPYKGKGIRYSDETVHRKEAKKK